MIFSTSTTETFRVVLDGAVDADGVTVGTISATQVRLVRRWARSPTTTTRCRLIAA